jgi:biotin synthase-related radical SAM superfamily protein
VTALSRVNWPSWPESEVLQAVEEAHDQGRVERCCVQATASPESLHRIKEIAARLGGRMAVSASVVASVDHVAELLDAGVERVGLSLDAVNEETYRRVKGGDLSRSLSNIEEAAARFPGRITTHLMVGLGETEDEMVRMMALLLSWRVTPSLFAFTPIRGTAMESVSPPPLDRYRRIQAARHLLVHGVSSLGDFHFSGGGRITYFGLPASELETVLGSGRAFRTSGCPGCNRPYYNEPPRGPLYNFPRPPSASEARQALATTLSHR